jgi:hypothetical protein
VPPVRSASPWRGRGIDIGVGARVPTRQEERLGIPVVAYEAESPFATLSPGQLEEVRRVEVALGVRLLAYRA